MERDDRKLRWVREHLDQLLLPSPASTGVCVGGAGLKEVTGLMARGRSVSPCYGLDGTHGFVKGTESS